MTTPDFLHIDPRLVLPSATNPRKHFDPVKLQELADSIAASGVHQPVLLRPLPAARVPDTVGLKPRPTHEMVAGERRLRASLKAGVATIPAMVQDLTDAQVLEIQIVENLQRDDLSALEEAEGYQHLMQHSALTADAVAAKIGKSRSYVYGRLKLLDLAPEARQALAEGKLDASRALLIARIPDGKLQAEATKELTRTGYTGDPVYSARGAAHHIEQHYMLRLNDAKFSRGDAALVPEAGACKACPKRTGANPDLFADIKGADVCTDPPCYRRKEQAHADAQLKAARESGAEVIEGREAKRLMPSAWSTRVEGHLRLDDKSDSPGDKPLRTLIGQQMKEQGVQPVLVANPHKPGEVVAVLPAEQVTALLHAAGQDKAAAQVQGDAESQAKYDARAAAAKAKSAIEAGWRADAVRRIAQRLDKTYADVYADIACPKAMQEVLRYAALHFVGQLNTDRCKALAKLLDLGKVAPKAGVEQWVQGHEDPAVALLVLVAYRDSEWCSYRSEHDDDHNAGLSLVAAQLGVDLREVEREYRAEARAKAKADKAAAESPKADLPLAPAARRKRDASADADGPAARRGRGAKAKPVKAPAIDEAQAREAIAAAMQAQEPKPGAAIAAQSDEARPALRPATPAPRGAAARGMAVGQQVKVLASATGEKQLPHVGKTGPIVAQLGDEAWDVSLPTGRKGSGLSTRVAFHQSELEVVS